MLAINYIHASNIIYRDLKLENIMVDIEEGKDGQSDLTCKITDFGFACMMDPARKKTLSLGTPLYMAPEVLNRSYDKKCDIWSLGVITYILLTGKAPFDGKDRDETYHQIRYGRIDWDCLSQYHDEGKHVKDFISRCLDRNANKRWSAAELLEHSWLTKLVENNEVQDEELIDTCLNIYTFK